MNDPKPWYQSKTILANILLGLSALAAAFGADLGLDDDTRARIVAGALALGPVINVILRAVTRRPVTARKPGATTLLALLLLAGGLPLGGCAQYEAGRATAIRAGQAAMDRVVEDAVYVICWGGSVRAIAKALPTPQQQAGRYAMCTPAPLVPLPTREEAKAPD